MTNMKKQAAASNGEAAVLIGESESIGLVLLRYAPSAIGSWERRAVFNALCDRAAAKLGYKRDRRCRNGWRKLPECNPITYRRKTNEHRID